MPVTTREKVQGYAHCIALKGTCPGYAQEPVDAVLETVGKTYGDMGSGDGGPLTNVVENSSSVALFANEEDRPCPHCGTPREISDQVRKEYKEHIPGADAQVAQAVGQDARIAELERQIAALSDSKDGG